MKDSLNEGNKLLAKELSIMWVKPRCCSISGKSGLLLQVEINVININLKLPLKTAAIILKCSFISFKRTMSCSPVTEDYVVCFIYAPFFGEQPNRRPPRPETLDGSWTPVVAMATNGKHQTCSHGLIRKQSAAVLHGDDGEVFSPPCWMEQQQLWPILSSLNW